MESHGLGLLDIVAHPLPCQFGPLFFLRPALLHFQEEQRHRRLLIDQHTDTGRVEGELHLGRIADMELLLGRLLGRQMAAGQHHIARIAGGEQAGLFRDLQHFVVGTFERGERRHQFHVAAGTAGREHHSAQFAGDAERAIDVDVQLDVGIGRDALESHAVGFLAVIGGIDV